ncbi:MAG: tetratricopeptide repeat protein [Planctomycetota bacterium]|jgi:Flp pilus assembly protein TadD
MTAKSEGDSEANAGAGPREAGRGPRRRPAIPWWRKALYASIACVLFFVALELILALCGVTPVVRDEDPYVGFSSWIPLFVEGEAGGRAVLMTAPNKLRFFNPQQFPKSKPDDAFRIFCLGGSTTYGRPYHDPTSFCGWLRNFLPAADPSKSWEVVNAGGISYASYRVTKLMEELARYEPDLFIIYSGHNEFLERRTYASRFQSPSGLDALGGLLAHSRTYAVLQRVLRGRQTGPGSSAGDSAYQLPAEVVTMLDQSVGPEAYERDDPLRKQILAHYRHNLKRMVRIAGASGAQVILVVPASNLRDSSPFKSATRIGLTGQSRRALWGLTEQVRKLLGEGNAGAALKAADHALEIDRRYAELHFLRGHALLRLERYEEARQSFLLAVEEDVCPLRAFREIQQAVVDVAQEHDVPCVDFAGIVREAAEHGIPGKDLFLDHVHPTIATNCMLANVVLDEMAARGLVVPRQSWGQAAIDEIARRVEGSLDNKEHGIALRNLSKVLGWAGKVEEAGELAMKAVDLAPDDPETQFQAGIVCEERDELAAAERHYRRAFELDPGFSAVHINLGVVLGKQGKYAEARAEFEAGLKKDPHSPLLLANLARVAAFSEDFRAAVAYQRQAVRYAPPGQRSELAATLGEYESMLRESGR